MRGAAVLALVGIAACSNTDRPMSPHGGSTGPAAVVATVYSCVVAVRTGAVTCTAGSDTIKAQSARTAGARRVTARDTVIGGSNGQFWGVAASNWVSDTVAQTFSFDLDATNDLAMSMGTTDGVTTTGMKVFFSTVPHVLDGTGTVSVANATGTGTFNGATVPYFEYDTILRPGKTTAPELWVFNVPNTVLSFGFAIELYTGIPPFRTPTGFTLVDSTGPITTAPPAAGGTATLGVDGNGHPVTWTFFSDANLTLTSASDAKSTGYRISFPSTLTGGSSAANWETDNSVAQTGYLYLRYRVRVDPRWTSNGNVSTVFMFLGTPNNNGCTPETQGHSIAGRTGGTLSDLYVTMSLQCDVSRNLGGTNTDGTVDSAASNVSVPNANIWHTVEILAQPEAPLGTGNDGVFSEWVDGLEVSHVTDVNYWASANTSIGWTALKMQSEYGGGPNAPPALTPAIWQDIDQIYMAVK